GFKRYKLEFKDSNRVFWTAGHAEVKIISLCVMSQALQLFESLASHPILILVLTMEVSIFSFFILLYTFAIDRYMPFIFWPIAEIFNDLFASLFLTGSVVFAIKARRTLPKPYLIAVILTGIAAFLPLVDIYFQRVHFRNVRLRKRR
ncbi:CKLF-like MARVEL transmembrane domain-containing protein 2A, partial [Acomys russatus]|uniref:CKLF-like MARVEL transmembrane domain-containing protein 2A n=1 Tax=Acomys russatus TaxID=60746 RepID=UPI0021E1EC65